MTLMLHWLPAATQLLADLTPSPTPTSVSDDTVTPGPIGFLAIAFVAFVTIGLIYDAIRRLRRLRYRQEIVERLEAEAAEAAEAAGEPGAGNSPAE